MDKVAILIPVFNEEKTILNVVRDFKKYAPIGAKIYVYDNNSNDKSYDVIKSEKQIVVRKEINQGKGCVVRSMFREIDANVYVLVDGDSTYNAKDVKNLIKPILDGTADMVIGDRLSTTYFVENKRLFHNFGNKLMRFLVKVIFKNRRNEDVRDVMTGYRSFSRKFVKTFPCLSDGFELETEMTIHAIDKNIKVKNVPVEYKDRPKDSLSKLNTIVDGIKVIFTVVKYFALYKPLNFFGIISFFLFFLSTAEFIPVLNQYFVTGLVLRFPTLIVCMFTYVVSLLSLFTGLILELMNKNTRQDFEYKFKNVGDKCI